MKQLNYIFKSLRLLLVPIIAVLAIFPAQSQNLRISGSNTHSVIICDNGSVLAWGNNGASQIGIDPGTGNAYPNASYSTPRQVGELPEIFQLDAGSGAHTLALTCDGQVVAWGANANGQLGNLTTAANGEAMPQYVAKIGGGGDPQNIEADRLNGISFVSGGNDESFAITEDGRVVAWGQNDQGQLGDGTTTERAFPEYVINGATNAPLENVVTVEAGDENGYALTEDGTVYSWGATESNALARDNGNNRLAFPVEINAAGDPLTGATQISAGDRHILVLTDNGTLWAGGGDWGQGQIGDGDGYWGNLYMTEVVAGEFEDDNPGATLLGEGDPIVEIAAGQAHSMAVTASGAVYTWGSDGFFNCGTGCTTPAGQLGVGCLPESTYLDSDSGPNAAPMRALEGPGSPLTGAVGVSDGDAWTFVIKDDGTILVAGFNENGELGLGTSGGPQCYFTELDIPGCGVQSPCPIAPELGDTLITCDGFTRELVSGLIYPDFEVSFVLDGDTVDQQLNTTLTAQEYTYDADEYGIWQVVIRDQRSPTNRPCEPCELARDSLVILPPTRNFTDPGNEFCPPIIEAYVDGDGKYFWYADSAGTTPIDTTFTTDSTFININDLANFDDTLWVEEIGDGFGTVFPENTASSCVDQWVYLNSSPNPQFQAQFTAFKPLTVEEVTVKFRVNVYGIPNTLDGTVAFTAYGANDDGTVNQADVLGQFTEDINFTATTSQIQDSVFERTIPINIEIDGENSGTQFFLSFDEFTTTSSQYNLEIFRSGCLGFPYEDDLDQTSLHYTGRVNNFGGSVSTDEASYFYDVQFSTSQSFCARVPFIISEAASCCAPPTSVLVDQDTPEEVCVGEDATFTGTVDVSGQTPKKGDYYYYWVFNDGSGESILGTPSTSYADLSLTGVTMADSGMYYLRVEDAASAADVGTSLCLTQDSIQLIVYELPDLTPTDPDPVCEPNTVDITGTWTDGNSTSPTVTYHSATPPTAGNELADATDVSPSGTYYILADNNGCTDEASVEVTINTAPDLTITNPDSVCTPDDVDITGSWTDDNSTSPTVTYHSAIPPTAGNELTAGDAGSIITSGTYYVLAENNGCTDTAAVEVTINETPDLTPTDPDPVCAPNTVDITGTWTDGNSTSPDVTYHSATPPTAGNELADATDVSPSGTYYILADNNGCTDEVSVEVTINTPPALTITPPAAECAPDDVDITGTWTDANSTSPTVTYHSAIPPTAGNELTAPGAIVDSGAYYVFADNNGCTDTAEVVATIYTQPEATITGGGTICDDGSATADLEITLDAGTGPFSVDLIRNSGTPTALTSLTSPHTEPVMDEGTYTIDNLVDDNGCSGTVSGSAAVDYFDELAANANPVCGTDAIGGVTLANDEFQIIVEITGGDASDVTGDNGVTFTDGGSGVWYSGAIDETLDIAVTAVDANGCANVDFSNVNQRCSCPVTASSTLTPTIICEEGDADLEVTYGTSGSSTTYNITLTKPDNSTEVLSGESGPTSTFTVSQAGIYSVAVEGVQDNCSVNGGTETLSHHPVPTATISGTATICDDGTTTDLTIGLGDGTAPFSVDILQDGNPFQSLTNESSPATVSVSTAGAYTLDPLTLTDDNGCEGTVSGTATITTVTPPTATLTDPASGDTVQTGTDDYSLTATPAGTGYDMDWTILNGQGALSNETDGSADLTGLTDKVTNTVTQVEITVSDAGGICPSATDTGYVERVDQTQAEAGPDSTICEGTAFTREGNGIIASLETAEWNYIGGGTAPAFTTSADGKELSVAASVAPGSYQFEYTVTHQINGPTSDDFTLTVDANPTNTALTQDPITTCAADIALPGQTPSPASAVGEWIITSFAGSTSPTVAGANDPTSQITGLPNGATELEWTVTNGVCPPVTEDLTINKVGDLTSPNIALDGGVYNNADVSGGDANLCEISTYDLQGAVPATDESAAWSVVSGTSVSLNNPLTDPAQPLTINGPGTTALEYTISTTVSGCSPVTGSVSLTVYEENVAVINTIDNTICEGTDLNVTTDAILSEDHGEWTIPPSADLTINNADSTDITVSNLDVSTTTTLQWVVSDAGCPDDQTSVSTFVEENKTPTLSISATLLGIPQNDGDTICDQSNIVYEVNTQNIDQTSLSWTVSGTSGQFPGSDNETISPSTTGTFIVEVTGDIPSATPSCYTDTDASDVFELEAIDGPTPTLIHPTDTVICETEPDYIIRAGTDAANTWDWYVNSTRQINKGDKDTLLALGTPGIYDVYIKEDNGKCPAVNSDTTTIRVDEQPNSEIMSNNYIGFINQDLILQGRTTIYDTIVWMQPSGYDVLNRTDTLTPAVNSPEGFVEQPFTMYVLNGECIDSANTLVTIRTPVKIYNSFTPNGDGVNDTWTIEGIETYQNATIRVYNRWGNLVHEQLGGYRNAWNGTRNGKEMPVGTYYYIVDLGTEREPLRGDVTIVR